MKKNILAFFLLVLYGNLWAQQQEYTCGAEIPADQWENEFQKLISQYTAKKSSKERGGNITYIPVIFHVVHGGEPVGVYPNLAAGQLQSQIAVLNQDFSGNPYNAGAYPSNAFVNWAINQNIAATGLDSLGRIKIADMEIQFCPALRDTNGTLLAEPGIDRINYLNKGWASPTTFSTQTSMKNFLDSVMKPQSIWDVRKYMNIWISDKSNQLSYGGVSSVPPLSGLPDIAAGATAKDDGIWGYAKVTGSAGLFPQGTYVSPFIDGRTICHEAGHYFGLRHIWGDALCGNDFCDDTPPAAGENTGSPVYPHQPGSCSTPSNSPDGEMFMNYMDYSLGSSKCMFTPDQKTRARTALLNSPFRNQLGTHGICDNTSSWNEKTNAPAAEIFPNPSGDMVHIRLRDGILNMVEISDLQGRVIRNTSLSDIHIEELDPGLYLLRVHTSGRILVLKFKKI